MENETSLLTYLTDNPPPIPIIPDASRQGNMPPYAPGDLPNLTEWLDFDLETILDRATCNIALLSMWSHGYEELCERHSVTSNPDMGSKVEQCFLSTVELTQALLELMSPNYHSMQWRETGTAAVIESPAQ
ncbi:hypothetical protein DTO280E4_5197 [Paecilomyces variotii]|nr:hypothetical protein DTO021D3_6280 [Paecilomyces variotii]KAJ9340866.1 hypothetical protein DTO027B6_6553 [Paecilomyces variotii]KAJ9358438.1 hypothetical protein DTO280E4_5197 [Paecilomyces variotii]KAJ9380717.1 hypothetical protein DTO032I4_6538 [Paecilomyces variotii]